MMERLAMDTSRAILQQISSRKTVKRGSANWRIAAYYTNLVSCADIGLDASLDGESPACRRTAFSFLPFSFLFRPASENQSSSAPPRLRVSLLPQIGIHPSESPVPPFVIWISSFIRHLDCVIRHSPLSLAQKETLKSPTQKTIQMCAHSGRRPSVARLGPRSLKIRFAQTTHVPVMRPRGLRTHFNFAAMRLPRKAFRMQSLAHLIVQNSQAFRRKPLHQNQLRHDFESRKLLRRNPLPQLTLRQ
jgi:hypothetical protein